MSSLLSSDFVSALLAFGLVLIPAIVIHEFGHFLAARSIGVNVLEFGIGFPPRMVRLFMWSETEFTLNWLPIGGFVRPLGEDFIGPKETRIENLPEGYISEREELLARGVPEHKLLSVNEAKPLPRIWFMVAGAFANFLSAIAVFVLVALIGLPTIIGDRMQVVGFNGEPPSPMVMGDAIEQINGEFFQGVTDFWEKLSKYAGETVKLSMRSATTGESYDISINLDAFTVLGQVRILSLVEGSPATLAGFLPDDVIIAINGNPIQIEVSPATTLQNIIADNAGKTVKITVLREEMPIDLDVVPEVNPSTGKGRIGVGILPQYGASNGLQVIQATPQEELRPQPLIAAVEYGIGRFAETIGMIVSIPSQLASGTITAEEARPVSIVGISQVGGQFLRQSVDEGNPTLILNFFALISIFLGFTNLLPLPPLDGGRVLFILIEIVRGKPVPIHIENLVYRVGITFLLSLGGLVILYDIVNPFVLVR